ncbi:MAG TPA: zinc ribbon domain-containing protein [Candidatus Omnitrophota bacterium]|nr:zinc ribbon domain-containing protein [Candidatus Omnitrophota bacterium]HRY85229.1 zinc ribbon domain-containing protein [Candidatus Omnitrophota bacterium]
MPTYEYECGACGHRFEKFQSMKDRPVKTCPACGKSKAQRIIHGGAGILFKGSGFYQTDYRSKGYKEAAKKDKPHSPSKELKVNGTSPGNLSGIENRSQGKPSTPSCSGDCSSCPTAKK